MKKQTLLSLAMAFILCCLITAQRQHSTFGNSGFQNQQNSALQNNGNQLNKNSTKLGTQKNKTDIFDLNTSDNKTNKKKRNSNYDQSAQSDTTKILKKNDKKKIKRKKVDAPVDSIKSGNLLIIE